jgi:hypothetical protein
MADLSVTDLLDDQDFRQQAPEVQDGIFRQYAAEDKEFQKQPKEVQAGVRSRILGVSSGKAGLSAPVMPYAINQGKAGLAGTIGAVAGFPIDIGRGAAQSVYQAATDPTVRAPWQIKLTDPLKYTKAITGAVAKPLGVESKPIPLDEYGRPSKSAEYIGKFAEFTGASLIPGGGVVGMAARRGLGPALAAAGTEVGIAGFSALDTVHGKQLGERYLGPYVGGRETGGQIGELIGAATGPVMMAKGVEYLGRGAGKVASMTGATQLMPDAQRSAGKALAIDELRNSMYPDVRTAEQTKANLEESAQLQQQIPGFNPTLGQATNAPGVIELEKKVGSRNAEAFAEAEARKGANEVALEAFRTKAFPSGEGSPVQAAALRYRGISAGLLTSQNKIEDQIRALNGAIDRSFTPEMGKRLDDLYMDLRKNVKTQAEQKYASVYKIADDNGVRIEMSDIGNFINKLKTSDPAAFNRDVIPGSFQEVIDRYSTKSTPGRSLVTSTGKKIRVEQGQEIPPGQASFQELHSLYKRTFRDYGRARDDQTRNYIKQLQDALKSKLDNFERSGPVGEVMSNLTEEFKAANEFYRKNYASVFKSGLGDDIARKSVFSGTTPDERLVRDLIFKPDNEVRMGEFFQIYGDNPEARKLLNNGVMDVFAREIKASGGEITPAAVKRFQQRYSRALEYVPDMQKTFSNVQNTIEGYVARRAEVQQQRKMLDRTVLSDIAEKSGARQDPQAILNLAIKDRQYMLALLNKGKLGEEERKSLSRSIADKVSEQKDPYQFLLDNQETLKPAMITLGGSEHWANLERMAKAQKIMNRVPDVGNIGEKTLQDIGKKLIGTPVNSIFSQSRAAAQGRQSKPYMFLDMGGKYIFKIKSEEADRVLREAIYDPDLLSALSKVDVPVGEISKQSIINVKHHLMSHGVRVLSATAADRYLNQ